MKQSSKGGKLDRTDLYILERLEADEEINLSELSDEVGLSKSAIHYRLNNLKEDGVITGMSARLDPQAFDLEMMIITEVMAKHEADYAENIGEALTEIGGVTQVYYTMGDVDFIVISRTQNRDQMNDLINEIVDVDGVDKTSSTFVMDEFKADGRVLANMSEEMRDNVCKSTGKDGE